MPPRIPFSSLGKVLQASSFASPVSPAVSTPPALCAAGSVAGSRPCLPKSKSHQLRRMSSHQKPTGEIAKSDWVVILPDRVGILPKRMEVRP